MFDSELAVWQVMLTPFMCSAAIWIAFWSVCPLKKKSKKTKHKIQKKKKVARDKVFQDEYCKCPLSYWVIYHRTLYFNDYLVTWFPFVPYVSFPHWTSSRAVSTSEVLGPPWVVAPCSAVPRALVRSGLSYHAEALFVLVSSVGFNSILPHGITSSMGDATQPTAYLFTCCWAGHTGVRDRKERREWSSYKTPWRREMSWVREHCTL